MRAQGPPRLERRGKKYRAGKAKREEGPVEVNAPPIEDAVMNAVKTAGHPATFAEFLRSAKDGCGRARTPVSHCGADVPIRGLRNSGVRLAGESWFSTFLCQSEVIACAWPSDAYARNGIDRIRVRDFELTDFRSTESCD